MIFDGYRTNESPAQRGFVHRAYSGSIPYEVKLYWAPSDFNDSKCTSKRPYLVVLVHMGRMNEYGRYEFELRNARYVGSDRPRRNHKELTAIAESYHADEFARMVDGMIAQHFELVRMGFKRTRCGYEYPDGWKDVTKEQRDAMQDRVNAAERMARNAKLLEVDHGEGSDLFDLTRSYKMAQAYAELLGMDTDEDGLVATAHDVRHLVRDEVLAGGGIPTYECVEAIAGQLLAQCGVTGEVVMNVREWYQRTFSTDELGLCIDKDATFMGLYDALCEGRDVYEYLDVPDSVVRERVFRQLAAMMGREYDYVYEWWLHHNAA